MISVPLFRSPLVHRLALAERTLNNRFGILLFARHFRRRVPKTVWPETDGRTVWNEITINSARRVDSPGIAAQVKQNEEEDELETN